MIFVIRIRVFVRPHDARTNLRRRLFSLPPSPVNAHRRRLGSVDAKRFDNELRESLFVHYENWIDCCWLGRTRERVNKSNELRVFPLKTAPKASWYSLAAFRGSARAEQSSFESHTLFRVTNRFHFPLAKLSRLNTTQ